MRWPAMIVLGGCSFHPHAASDDTSGDASPDTSGMAARCGTPGAIRDGFDDATAAAVWTPDTAGGNVLQQGGRLTVTPMNGRFAGYRSKHYVDLTGGAIEVEVPQMLDTSQRGIAGLVAMADADNYLEITQSMGQLTAQTDAGGLLDTLAVSYDPVQHRFWRISEAAGRIVYETSPDGTTWQHLHDVATPAFATALQIDLGTSVGTGAGGGPFGTVGFDNLNTALPPATWCKADTFHDDFQRTSIGYAWANSRVPDTLGCDLFVQAGAHADQRGAPTECYFGTSAAYDLGDAAVVVQIDAITDFVFGWQTFVEAVDDAGGTYRLFFDSDQLCATAGGAPTCRAYDPAEIYWRIGATAGTLTFDASADKATWDPVLAMPVALVPSSVELRLGTASTVNLTVSPIGLTFSSYNE